MYEGAAKMSLNMHLSLISLIKEKSTRTWVRFDICLSEIIEIVEFCNTSVRHSFLYALSHFLGLLHLALICLCNA